jgi:hypothetical protein
VVDVLFGKHNGHFHGHGDAVVDGA